MNTGNPKPSEIKEMMEWLCNEAFSPCLQSSVMSNRLCDISYCTWLTQTSTLFSPLVVIHWLTFSVFCTHTLSRWTLKKTQERIC